MEKASRVLGGLRVTTVATSILGAAALGILGYSVPSYASMFRELGIGPASFKNPTLAEVLVFSPRSLWIIAAVLFVIIAVAKDRVLPPVARLISNLALLITLTLLVSATFLTIHSKLLEL